MIARIDEARSNGDTVGGVFEVVAHGLPIGLGSYVQWDRRLDAALAAAVMSINIVKGVEFGLGFEQTKRFGSAVHDVIEGRGEGGRWIHRSNNAGGLTGGITNGEPLVVRGAVKPISTLARPLPSADLVSGEAVDKAHYERSDISVVPAAGVVGEAMVDAHPGRRDARQVRRRHDRRHARRARALRRADLAAPSRRRSRVGDGRGTAGGHAAARPAAAVPRPAATKPAPAATTRPPAERWTSSSSACPGSGKSAVGRRLAHRHGATFVDLDDAIEKAAGRTIPEIFAERRRGRRSGRSSARPSPTSGRPTGARRSGTVVATGGGAVVDPRNRWALYRGRVPVWLDVRPEVLAQRLRRSPNVRPLIVGRDPMGAIRDLARDRDRFYSAAHRLNGVAELGVDRRARSTSSSARGAAAGPGPTVLLRGRSLGGDLVIGEGIAAAVDRRRAPRPARPAGDPRVGARRVGRRGRRDRGGARRRRLAGRAGPAAAGRGREAAGGRRGRRRASSPALRAERGEPLVAIGGGALGDAAGFLAATWLRGVPFIQVPTTLVAQIDSSIGGKTGVDLPEGKNLVGAFHPPAAIVIDIALAARRCRSASAGRRSARR